VLRRLLLLALALCGMAQAAAPRIEMTVTPAWKGWARPGRATEFDVRLSSDAATRATIDVVAGRHAVRADVDLEPGRAVRLHVPLRAAEHIAVSAAAPGASPQRREVALAQSESPLLGVGLATDEQVDLAGFHTVTLAADDLRATRRPMLASMRSSWTRRPCVQSISDSSARSSPTPLDAAASWC